MTAAILTCKNDFKWLVNCVLSIPAFIDITILETEPLPESEEFDNNDNINSEKLESSKSIITFRPTNYFKWYYKGRYNSKTGKHDLIDFDRARNTIKNLINDDWILQIDSDEILCMSKDDYNYIINAPQEVGAFICMVTSITTDEKGNKNLTIDPAPRVYRNFSSLTWQFKIHESAVNSLKENNYKIIPSNVIIRHDGYNNGNLVDKLERNFLGMIEDLKQYPNEPHLLRKLKQTIDVKVNAL